MLASDGNISVNSYDGKFVSSTYYSFNLSSSDKDIIEKLRDYINIGKVLEYQYNSKYRPTYVYKLRINSDEYEYFSSLGITEKKSLTLNVNKGLLNSPDFLRGIVDGDGSFGIKNRGDKGWYYRLEVTTGSKDFAEQLKVTFLDKFNDGKIRVDARGNKCYKVQITKKDSFFIALKTLYKNAPPELRMERRYTNAMGILDEWDM
jgi:DNA-binding transcriptional regulator WhiA